MDATLIAPRDWVGFDDRPAQLDAPAGFAHSTGLSAIRAAAKLWLVASHAPGHSFDPRRDLSWRQARPGVLSRICDLLDEAGTPATELEVLRLSGCGPSYSAADRRRLGDLRGSDLVFLDPDAAAKFGDAELASFAELGINRLIFSAFDSESEIEEVRFSSRSANRRSNARRIASETFPGARKSRRRVDSSRRMGELVDRLSASAHVGPGYTLEHGDRIVLVTYALPPGGAERQWVYLARGLKQAGYDVALVTYVELTGDNAHYLPWLEKSQIPVFPVVHRPPITLAEWLASDSAFRRCVAGKMAPYPEIILGLVETFRRLRPKAVIGQLDYPNLFSGLAALLAGVPRAVMSFRSYIPTRCGNFYEDWYRPAYAVLSRSPRILLSGICADANREYADWIGVARDRVACIPNAIDPEDFPACDADAVEALRAELCLEPGQPVILGVFRLSKEKNPAAFVEVCSRLVASAPGLHAVIAGVGPLLPVLQELVAARGVSDNFHFVGRRSDINVLMTLADLLLLTSDVEAVGNVIVEAQLMGLPVVATDAARAGGAMCPGVTGLLCPTGDINALHDACLDLLRDPGLRRRMGDAGRRHAATQFSMAVMAQRYRDLICRSVPAVKVAGAAAAGNLAPIELGD
jgi:glycosyltransferase involved in cell wall biosynthesis